MPRTHSNFAPCLPWIYPGSAENLNQPSHYHQSPAVREMLVLLALSSSTKELPQDLQDSMPGALDKVTCGLRSGMIRIDYAPASEGIVDIPPVNHQHYMQAVLYWSARLGCTLERMVEAHARLGPSPTVAHVTLTIAQIEREDATLATQFDSTHESPQASPPTVPVFARTYT